ncbi:hypothetical protein B0H13DRAFT_2302706 [Mycena leptocephala]|nr:hypothetical protein B0H13DRAFT_2302706 [Mycena leptocephala]
MYTGLSVPTTKLEDVISRKTSAVNTPYIAYHLHTVHIDGVPLHTRRNCSSVDPSRSSTSSSPRPANTRNPFVGTQAAADGKSDPQRNDPGPREQTAEQLQTYLKIIVDDLVMLYDDGILVETPEYPNGLRVRVALVPIIAGHPAMCKLCGFANYGHSAASCPKCKALSSGLLIAEEFMQSLRAKVKLQTCAGAPRLSSDRVGVAVLSKRSSLELLLTSSSLASPSFLRISLKHCAFFKLLLQDPKVAKCSITTSPRCPEFPYSEWTNLVNGRPVNLDAVLSGFFSTSTNDERSESLGGGLELRFRAVAPAKLVSDAGTWTIAFDRMRAATLFVYRANSSAIAITSSACSRPRAPYPMSGAFRSTKQLVSALRSAGASSSPIFTGVGIVDAPCEPSSGASRKPKAQACNNWNNGRCSADAGACTRPVQHAYYPSSSVI